MLHLYLFSTTIFMLTALLNLLIACLPTFRGLAAQDFLLLVILILSIFLMQELISIFSLSSFTLVNFLLLSVFHPSMTLTLSKKECQDTSHTKLDFHPLLFFFYCSLCRVWRQGEFFLSCFCLLLASALLMYCSDV